MTDAAAGRRRGIGALLLILGAVLAIAALLFDIWGGVTFANATSINDNGAQTTAIVVSTVVERHHTRRGTNYYSVAAVEYTTMDGEKLETTVRRSIDTEDGQGYEVGDRVEVVYDVDDPSRVVEAGVGGWAGPVVFLVVGGVLTISALALLIVGFVLVRRVRETAPAAAG